MVTKYWSQWTKACSTSQHQEQACIISLNLWVKIQGKMNTWQKWKYGIFLRIMIQILFFFFFFFHFHILRNFKILQKIIFYRDKIEYGMTNKTKNNHFREIFENHKFQSTPWWITDDSYCKSRSVIISFPLGS